MFLADTGSEMIHYTIVDIYHSPPPSRTFLRQKGEVEEREALLIEALASRKPRDTELGVFVP